MDLVETEDKGALFTAIGGTASPASFGDADLPVWFASWQIDRARCFTPARRHCG
jgi:hypothetical protein